jgi:N-acetylglucosaminyl-diphospho-decaprenol L-rhamnosyltransferase
MKDMCIVFVNYHHCNDIDRALDSITRDRKDDYAVEIVVVDNSLGVDGMVDLLASKYPHVKYILPEKNIGFAGGNNLGFSSVSARYYFCLNGDTEFIVGTNTIGRLIEFMDSHDKIGMVAPKLVGMGGERQNSCYRFDFRSILVKPLKQAQTLKNIKFLEKTIGKLQMSDFDQNKTQPIDWALGAALVVRREAVDEVGYMDERYFLYLEDCDWCRSMWESGWAVYFVHDIVVKHRYERASSKISGVVRPLLQNNHARLHLVSWFKYLWKWRCNHRYFGRIR